jgi:5-methylcytosine-specific restriction endonuclease McrA
MASVKEALRQLVRDRAGGRCEYCGLPQEASSVPFEIDHVIAVQHGGRTVRGNLALACFYCNSSKGPNIASIDRVTKRLVRLFNPRRHRWDYHFR